MSSRRQRFPPPILTGLGSVPLATQRRNVRSPILQKGFKVCAGKQRFEFQSAGRVGRFLVHRYSL
jgi:hypothetical protein